MPIYAYKEKFKLSKEMEKRLKGKSCFHIRDINPQIKKEFKQMLKEGFAAFKKEGWL